MKKAATHIEWVISMGIFLIFIISLFIVLKPGYKQPFAGDTLLNILEDNFNEEVYWTIKTTPLIIGGCADSQTKTVIIEICNPDYCPSTAWKFRDGSTIYTKSFTNSFNDELIYHPLDSEEVELKIQQSACSTTLGITEDLIGVSEDKLNDLLNSFSSSNSIKDLKNKWKYPKNQEFAIKIKKETDANSQEYKTSDIEPSDTYAKEFKTWIIDKDKNKRLITINLQVW